MLRASILTGIDELCLHRYGPFALQVLTLQAESATRSTKQGHPEGDRLISKCLVPASDAKAGNLHVKPKTGLHFSHGYRRYSCDLKSEAGRHLLTLNKPWCFPVTLAISEANPRQTNGRTKGIKYNGIINHIASRKNTSGLCLDQRYARHLKQLLLSLIVTFSSWHCQ